MVIMTVLSVFITEQVYAVSNLLAYSARASAYHGGSGGHGFSLDAVSPGYMACDIALVASE